MKCSTLITAILIISCTISAVAKTDNDLLKANYLYTHLAFHEAIGYYQKIAANNDPLIAAHLGDCYRLTKDPEQAATWYGKAISMNGCPDDVKLHYAMVLMNLKKYDEALPLLQQYKKTVSNDRRIDNMITSCAKADEMASAMPNGSVFFETFNISRSTFGPSLKRNELFFTADTVQNGRSKIDNWTGTPFYKIYSVTCDGGGQCNNQMKELGGNINTKYHDGPCMFNKSGNTMYFTRTNYINKFLTKSPVPDKNDVVHLEIMIATDYDEAKGVYKTIKPFPYNSKDYSVAHPAISQDENMIIFSSDMKGGEGGTDLYMCIRNGKGNWSSPQSLGNVINTEGDEMFPFLGADNTLYFASNGHVGFGGLDIYQAKWNAATNSFSEPENMGVPVNSSYDDMSLVFTDDNETGYFASDRPAAMGGDNIYRFTKGGIYLDTHVTDAGTSLPIPGATVSLNGGNDARTMATDAEGNAFTQLYPNMAYAIKANAPGYEAGNANASTMGTRKTDTLQKEIKLSRNFSITYSVVVMDETTNEPIENPQLIFVDDKRGKADSINLQTGQVYDKKLDANKSYHVYAMKENYYGNEKYISTMGINPNAGGVQMKDTLFMKKLQVGQVYKIDNIYYDYNKANIREDAKPALNSLLDVLNKYPQMTIQVNSHTDCRGSDSYNMKLSDARAHSVIKYLQERGVSIMRLKYKGYGESEPVEKCPVCEECTEAQHQKNRRTEFQILSM